MDLAFSISETEIIQENILEENGYIRIQNYIERIRLKTRIHYVYIVDGKLKIYSNPDSNLLGQAYDHFYNSEDILQVLSDESPVINYSGSTATSVEAVVPVYTDGILSGVVVVGMLNGRIYQEITRNILILIVFIFIIILCGILVSYQLSGSIKKSIRGLEPEEINFLLGQRELVIENLKEGIVYIDNQYRIIMINKSARELLGLKDSDFGENMSSHFSADGFVEALTEGRVVVREIKRGPDSFLLGRFYPVEDHDKSLLGVIASFEDLSIARHRAEELTGMHELTQALRAQNHEFMNKLHAVSGMIQLGETEEAVSYISDIVGTRQHITGLINSRLRIPAVAGLILSKFNRAAERRIDLNLDSVSSLTGLPPGLRPDSLSSILGNLIENAMDGLDGCRKGKIELLIDGDETQLFVSVADNGRGISDEQIQHIFSKGFSTKGADRGYGLYVVKNIIKEAGGEINVRKIESGGTNFFITIPEETPGEAD
jgi:sensor histidine kinase regulating citrate/malate metabolism